MEIKYTIAENQFGKYCIPQCCISIDGTGWDCSLATKLLKGGVYEKATIDYIRSICGTGDVIHAGAYFGDFIPGIATALAPDAILWAFEPSHEKYLAALETIEINKLENVKLMNIGLGEDTTYRYWAHGSIVSVKRDNTKNEKVLIRALDQVIPMDRKNISVLQLDVDLYEHIVLMGALNIIKKYRPVLILETVPPKEWFSENILKLGYVSSEKVARNFVYTPSKQ